MPSSLNASPEKSRPRASVDEHGAESAILSSPVPAECGDAIEWFGGREAEPAGAAHRSPALGESGLHKALSGLTRNSQLRRLELSFSDARISSSNARTSSVFVVDVGRKE